jgi:pyruvate kinase
MQFCEKTCHLVFSFIDNEVNQSAMQMLESTTYNLRATCVKIFNIDNAILNDANCIMLFSENVKKAYSFESVYMMHETARIAETVIFYSVFFNELRILLSISLRQSKLSVAQSFLLLSSKRRKQSSLSLQSTFI